MASLKDVAKLAGVSLMTVSRAINEPGKLRPDTYQRVKLAIDQLDYVPDLSARRIRGDSNRVQTLGVLALDTATTPFSVEMILSIEKTAREHGWNSFVVNLFADDSAEHTIDLLLAHRPDGVIFTTMGLRQVTVPPKLLDKKLVLANCVSRNNRVASYIPDDEQGQYDAMRALIAKGYRAPLCIHLPENTLAAGLRRRGLERAWHETGGDVEQLQQYHLDLTDGDERYRDCVALLERHFAPGRRDCDVVVCGNDRVAFMVYQVLLAQGWQIPQQVGVLGYDNMVGIGQLFLPPLTTVQLPHYELGRQAALHLINQLEHCETVKVTCPLLLRESM
ncbi:LacI family DNA-binding transcriptional regulator [Serratia inhibens]|uniref:LacI family DNA-binding transcriptional regulator n=1 Tax=Serratia inhibens TaxID=2338073 RepID=A0AA93BXE7_9GAMM|nr:LacI family DNA-binding transcriptional regulator [Serratia inhibens]ANS42563.1 HTH-type transcriptional repressor CytR [Serratia inhibens PRI-2C]RJF57933.1 LacI family DNA-binding transcriptional regulator [Serratia inhibens]